MYHTTYMFVSGGYVAKNLGQNFSLFYSLDILTFFLNKISNVFSNSYVFQGLMILVYCRQKRRLFSVWEMREMW